MLPTSYSTTRMPIELGMPTIAGLHRPLTFYLGASGSHGAARSKMVGPQLSGWLYYSVYGATDREHLQCAQRILKYVSGTKDRGPVLPTSYSAHGCRLGQKC